MAETAAAPKAAEPVVVPSGVREVSVFRSGAVVTRIAEVAPSNGAWPEEIALAGLPLAMDDESVRVSLVARGDATPPRPADLRVDLVVPPIGLPLLPPDEKELRDAEDKALHLRERLARVDIEVAKLDQIGLALPEPFENRPPKPAPTAAWIGVLDWKARWKAERAEERRLLHDELLRQEETIARHRRRLAEIRALQDSREATVSKRVRLRLREGGAPAPLELRLEYRVPGARWVPTYAFRLARDGKSASLAVKALVVQSSGEPWERVKLSVSTADLLRDTELPELKSLRIGRRQPEPPRRAWREPPSGLELLFEGLDRTLATMPAPPEPAPPPPAPPAVGALGRVQEIASEMDQLLEGGESEPEDARRADRARVGDKAERREAKKRMPAPKGAPALAGRGGGPMPPPPPAASVESTSRTAMRKPMPAPSAPASRMSMAEMAPVAASAPPMDDDAFGGMPGNAPMEPTRPEDLRPDGSMLRFSDLVMAGWDDGGRGRLRPVTTADRLAGIEPSHAPGVARRLADAEERAAGAAYVSFPDDTQDVESSSGAYDYRYDAEGLVDVPADGRIHAVPLFARSAPVATTLVVVPRESDQAVRVAEMRNPLDAPLLAGPAEIYLDDEYLVTSPIRTVPPGADLKIGLGVEEALKVARNTHFEEEATGLLGGGAAFHHRIDIELANRLASAVKVEVRERVPTKDEDDKDVEIAVAEPSPAWEDYDQGDVSLIRGGRRWKLTIGAGETKKIHWSYTVKIDAKNELVGGNRRE